jgi:Bacterial sugar transferase/Serine aminopeptidase, S33
MVVRNIRFYQTMQFVLDLLAVTVAWSCTIQMRVLLNPLASQRVSWSAASIWSPSLMMVLVLWIVMAWRLRFYRIEGRIRLWNSVMNAVEGALLSSCSIVVVTFFSRQLGTDVSRSFFMIFAPLIFVSLGLARCVSVFAAMVAERHWPSPIRAALLGDRSHAGHLISLMNSATVANAIKGLIIPEGHTTEGLSLPMPILGTTGQLAEVINREHLNRIILLNGSISHGELDECNKVFKRMGVIVNCTVDFAPERGRVNVVNQYGLPLVELRPLAFTKGQEIIKRGFDIVASALAVILLGPAMLVIAALAKFTSEGPILYKAPRVGRGGRHFMFLKFRSMYTATDRTHVAHANEKQGHIFKIKQDPRVTPIGRFIRRLDELPQLINVLLGEMSLVGPRPLPAGDLGPDGMSRENCPPPRRPASGSLMPRRGNTVQTERYLGHQLQEQAGYFEVPGAHLYTVVHQVEDPIGRVLLVGPFASERHNSYIPWVQWARYLAEKRVEVLRYDYRGIGESEGVFEEMSFAQWIEDVELLAGWLREQSSSVPVVLHGLEMGALLAGRVFHNGIGDLLLLWSPPHSANLALRAMLRRWVVVDQLFKYGNERRSASAYIRELEQGPTIEVDGYRWSSKLWHDSAKIVLPPAMKDEANARVAYGRPVRVVTLGKDAVPLIQGGYVVTNEAKDFTRLFTENWNWVAGSLGYAQGRKL